MDILSLLLQLILRAMVVVLPLTVSWLAFRRLMFSRSSNAWIYAIVCLFTTITSAGLIPWTMGLGSGNWLFFLFSAISPATWIGVILVCDPTHQRGWYDVRREDDGDADDIVFIPSPKKPNPRYSSVLDIPSRPLILEEPDWPDAPIPVFRHMAHPDDDGLDLAPSKREKFKPLLSIARDMRGNSSSDARRPRMLSAPDPKDANLPFLNRG